MHFKEWEPDRRRNLSREEFEREYLIPRRPVIIEDAMKDWPAREKWTPEWFRDNLGDREAPADEGTMRVSEFVDRLYRTGEQVPFLREVAIDLWQPDLLADLSPKLIYTTPNWIADWHFWFPKIDVTRGFHGRLYRLGMTDLNFTGKGRRFPFLHLDFFRCHALISQIYGRKRFFVFDPTQEEYLYPHPGKSLQGGAASQIDDVLNVDYKKFPLARKAQGKTFVLNPGDSLFNPTGWWHTTETLDISIATVTSFGDFSNWFDIIKDMFRNAPGPSWTFLPYAAYLGLEGIVKDRRVLNNAIATFKSKPAADFEGEPGSNELA